MHDSLRASPATPALPLAVTAVTSLGFLLVQLDVSIVNVALPTMGTALRSGTAGLQWIVDAYALTFAAFLLLAGSLGDRIGTRRIFLSGLALFLSASLGCGLAPTLGVMIAARGVQGLGAALMVPSSLSLLNHACAGDASSRHRAVALWTAAGSVGLALGPALGGVLVEALGWRAIFLVNLPTGACGVWLTLRSVSRVPGGGGDHLDWPGQTLAVLALIGLVGATIAVGSHGWASPIVLGGLGLAALALAGFVAVEARAAHPMLPLGFFRSRAFSAALAVGAAVNFTLYGTLFLVSLVLQRVRGAGAIETGWIFLPPMIAIGMANVLAGRLAAHVGTRALMAVGLVVAAAGFAVLRPLDVDMPIGVVMLGLSLMGAGIGTAVPTMTSALLATVPRERGGVASGVLNTMRQAAGAMGVGIFGALIAKDPAGARIALTIACAVSLAGAAAALATGREGGTAGRPVPRDAPS